MLKADLLRSDHIELVLALHALGLPRAQVIKIFESHYGFGISERAYRYALASTSRVTGKGIKRVLSWIYQSSVMCFRPTTHVLIDNLHLVDLLISSGISYRETARVLTSMLNHSVSEDQVQRFAKQVRSNRLPESYLQRKALWNALVRKAEAYQC